MAKFLAALFAAFLVWASATGMAQAQENKCVFSGDVWVVQGSTLVCVQETSGCVHPPDHPDVCTYESEQPAPTAPQNQLQSADQPQSATPTPTVVSSTNQSWSPPATTNTAPSSDDGGLFALVGLTPAGLGFLFIFFLLIDAIFWGGTVAGGLLGLLFTKGFWVIFLILGVVGLLLAGALAGPLGWLGDLVAIFLAIYVGLKILRRR